MSALDVSAYICKCRIPNLLKAEETHNLYIWQNDEFSFRSGGPIMSGFCSSNFSAHSYPTDPTLLSSND